MPVRQASPRRRASLALVLPALASMTFAAGCSVEEALSLPDCTGGGTILLVAQSVPEAELVPCFDPLPDGWDVVSVSVDQDGTVIRLDSDRAGTDAAVFRYVAECDVSGAVAVPSEYDDAEQFELVERIVPAFRSRRFHVFDGGCMWWDFDFQAGAGSALSIELGDRLHAMTRDALGDAVRADFLDVELR